MKTWEEQIAYFDESWPAMQQAVETGGGTAVIEFINSRKEDQQRRVLYMFANRGLVNKEWSGKNFDDYITIADAGIKHFLSWAESAEDEKTRNGRVDSANILSFNLSADLANCWPGDEAPREKRHFERGLQAAAQCIRWREELDKPGGPRSMAQWAHGMHQVSLGDAAGAVTSFTAAMEHGKQAAKDNDLAADVSANGGFLAIVAAGYLGIAQQIAGDAAGKGQYAEALEAFKAQLADDKKKDDAQFGIDQLETVKGRYL